MERTLYPRCIAVMLAAAVLPACWTLPNGIGDDDDGAPGSWADSVREIEIGEVVTADLADGETIPLDWADDSVIACWTGGEDTNFAGPHSFFALVQPAMMDLVVTVSPSPGVDVSLYAYQLGTSDHRIPPDLASAPVCEASFDAISDSNPGVAESVLLWGWTPEYNVVIGVAGAEGHDSGGFVLETEAVPHE